MNQKDSDDYNSGALGNPFAPGYGQLGYQAHLDAHKKRAAPPAVAPTQPATLGGGAAGLALLVLLGLTVVMIYGSPSLVLDFEVYGWALSDVIAYKTVDVRGVAIAYGIAFAGLWAIFFVALWGLRKIFPFLIVVAVVVGGFYIWSQS